MLLTNTASHPQRHFSCTNHTNHVQIAPGDKPDERRNCLSRDFIFRYDILHATRRPLLLKVSETLWAVLLYHSAWHDGFNNHRINSGGILRRKSASHSAAPAIIGDPNSHGSLIFTSVMIRPLMSRHIAYSALAMAGSLGLSNSNSANSYCNSCPNGT